MYFNIKDIIDKYTENFIFINGSRSIGKTYGTLKFIINNSIKNNDQFIYLCRTQAEKKSNVFSLAFDKVIQENFNDLNFNFTTENLTLDNEIIGYCFALTEMKYLKRRSFPNVKYIIFDEYLTEDNKGYISGNNEPDLILNIYHTVDRDKDKVKIIFLGNNAYFYNPYHLHPAFNIPSNFPKGKIYHKNNVIFLNVETPQNINDFKSQSRFGKMINSSNYSNYANNGMYSDNLSFIMQLSNNTRYLFTLFHNNIKYGIFVDKKNQCIIISYKLSNKAPIYTIDYNILSDNISLLTKQNYQFKFLSKYLKTGLLFFENAKIKSELTSFIQFLL